MSPRALRRSARVPQGQRLQALADLFQHLSDPRRLRLLLILAQGEHAVGGLAAQLGVTVSAVSHQLQVLRRARLVACRREGKAILYHLIDAHVEALVHVATEHVSER